MASFNPNYNLQQAQASGYPTSPNPSSSSDRPPRPGYSTAYTSSAVPTLPQLSPTQNLGATLSARPVTSSHSYSRSSPAAGYDQNQMQYANAPETPKYSGGPGTKYYTPQTPTGAPSYSPLALSDIRSRNDLSFSDDVSHSNQYLQDGSLIQTTNSYLAPWPTYAYDWCKWPAVGGSGAGKMAICSHLEDPHNYIQILDTSIDAQEVHSPGALPYTLGFTRIAEATCSYPVTRILWEPPSSQKQTTDLLATSGDHLRLWSMPSSSTPQHSNTISRSSSVNTRNTPPQKLTPLALLSNSKTPEHTAPLTSLDWNQLSPKLIITSSIDTTCTIWDIPTLTAKTQLIAHDKEVFDVRFCAGSVDTFVSCGADGSVRMFDLRSLEHSTIIYEPSEKSEGGNSPVAAQHSTSPAPPLLRLAASPHDSHLLATFAQDSNVIRILDHRQPGQALLELHGHAGSINCIEWSPSRRGMLASGGDDALVLCWDLINSQNSAALSPTNGQTEIGANAKGPASSWRCDYEVANLSWSPQSQLTSQGGEWLGVAGGRGVWGVKL